MSDGPNPVLWGGVQDPEFDKLVNAAVAAPRLDERKKLYLAAWQRVLDHYYTVVLGHGSDILAMRKEVRDYDTGFTWSPNWASGGVAYAWLADRACRPSPKQGRRGGRRACLPAPSSSACLSSRDPKRVSMVNIL